MARVNVFDKYGELQGWFDDEKAEKFSEARNWDGNNMISVATGSQWDHEALYRTAGGRWVLNAWSQYQGTLESYTFVSDKKAETWLLLNEHDEAVEQYFGEVAEERGPGRPEIGPAVLIRLPAEMLARLDKRAADEGVSRAELVRQLLEVALKECE